jgi:gliding motility-associated-like protein
MKSYLITALIVISAIGVHAQNVVANFSVDTNSATHGCLPLTVAFKDLSTGNPTNWLWDFGNSNTSTLQNPSATYSNAGTYTVKLVAYNATSTDSMIKINYITVFAKPVAGFILSANPVCQFDPVTFSDSSVLGSAPLSTWNWSFGDGNAQITTQNSIIHAYQLPGVLPISLSVTDTNGCTSTASGHVTVILRPTIVFAASPATSCTAPVTVAFTNSTTSALTPTYLWNFGDGSFSSATNPSHTYLNFGSYTVTLVVIQGGCVDSLVMPNYINIYSHAASFAVSDTTPCEFSDIVTFNNTSTPASASVFWNFGDGSNSNISNPTHNFSVLGSDTVTLIVTDVNGCSDTAMQILNVQSSPTISYTANDYTKCSIPATVNFTANTTGAVSWLWNFGNGQTSTIQNPTTIYNTTDTFYVTLTATSAMGCSNVQSTMYIVVDTPFVWFYADVEKGCAPLTVMFTDASVCSTDVIVSYHYDFGDGQSVNTTSAVVTHTYTSVGTYTVSHTITTTEGCTGTRTFINYITVSTPPQLVNFTPQIRDTICYGSSLSFTNISIGWDSAVFSSLGSLSQVIQTDTLNTTGILIFLNDTGTYPVTLIACHQGCCDTLTVDSLVHVLGPKARFNYQYHCTTPPTLSFTNTSEAADSIVWLFGDGNIDATNNQNPTHAYTIHGNYTIKLVAYNFSTGCVDTFQTSVFMSIPIANFTATPAVGCYPLKVFFNASTSQDASGYYKWIFGNGQQHGPNLNPIDSLIYYPGYYTVILVIQDLHGCRDTLTIDSLVHSYGPVMGYYANPRAGCPPFTATFVDTTHDEYPIKWWIWKFGGAFPNDTTTVPTATFTYNTLGTYTVSLTIVDSLGCTLILYHSSYIVVENPVANFNLPATGCRNQPITIDASASTIIGTSTFAWNFGDGTSFSSTSNNTTHIFSNDTTYIVTLTVTDSLGCDSTISHSIIISSPSAGFYVDTLQSCGLNSATFHPLDTINIASYNWYISNGASSVLQNPHFNFTVPGFYSATLVVTNTSGCHDTLTLDSIIVLPGPQCQFTFTPQNGCRPLTVQFTATGDPVLFYIWDFGDGNIDTTTVPTISHTYTYDLTALPNLTIVSSNNGVFCDFGTINQTGYINVQTINSVNILANGNNVDTVYVPLNTSINLSAIISPNLPANYIWQGNGLSCNNCQNPILTPTGNGYVIVNVLQPNGGCTESDTIYIVYQPCATLAFNIVDNSQNVIDSVILGGGEQIQLGVSTNSPSPSYLWQPAVGLSCTTCSSPVLTGIDSTLYYTVILSDQNGCSLRDSIKVIYIACHGFGVVITDSLGATLDTLSILQGNTVIVNAQPAVIGTGLIYTWSPTTGLSCANCANPVITGTGDNIIYIVSVGDASGCKTSDSIEVIGISCVDIYTLPNVFTPNGDGINDLYYIKNACPAGDYLLIIFNRWGNEIYRSTDTNQGWNGRNKSGTEVSEGTYYFILTVKGKTSHGHFELMRN